MRSKGILIFLCLLCVPALLQAEDHPKAEVFGGYSYFLANDSGGFHMHGWNASVTGNLTGWLGLTGDFSGHYHSPARRRFDAFPVDVNAHHLLFGPTFTYRVGNSIAPFAHVLIGVTRASAFGIGDSAMAGAIGGGLDINVSDSIAVRAFQADYFGTRFDDYRQDHFRFSAGVVFRLR